MLNQLILVVEDDPAIQFGLQMALQSRGYHVLTASDGHEALDILNHCDPDLILADIRMRPMGGLQMLLQVKSSAAHRHIPVVIISASPGDQSTALDSGATYFLRKPFDHSTLFEIIDSCFIRSIATTSHHPNDFSNTENNMIDSEKNSRSTIVEHRPLQSLNILMIDDDQVFAAMIEDSLVRDGHRVTVIHNWLSLLKQIKNETPDLILIDVETPTGNGVTAMEFLTMDPAVATIPKAFVTGVSDSETRRRCEAMGAEYLHKSGNIVNKIKAFIDDGIEVRCLT